MANVRPAGPGGRRSSRPAPRPNRSSTRGRQNMFGMLLLGILLGLLAAVIALFVYRRLNAPSLTSKPSASQQATRPGISSPSASLATRAGKLPTPSVDSATEPVTPPFGISEDVFEAGAHLYSSRCASCHGTPTHSSSLQPAALQLWKPNRSRGNLTGAAKQLPATIYRQVAAGNPAAGMPAYRGVLTSNQIWQLSLLLSSAGPDLPDPVLQILNSPPPR